MKPVFRKLIAAGLTVAFMASIQTNVPLSLWSDAFCGIMFYELNLYLVRCVWHDIIAKRRQRLIDQENERIENERARKAKPWADERFYA